MKELKTVVTDNPTAFLSEYTLPIDRALLYAMSIVKASVLGKRWGKNKCLLYYAIDHKAGTGLDYTLSVEDCKAVQLVLNDLGMALRSVALREGEQHQDLSPLFYGQTWAEKFRVLGKVFHLSYLLGTGLGKSDSWRENRLSSRKSKATIKFSDEDLMQMRQLFDRVSAWLINLVIIPQVDEVYRTKGTEEYS